MTKYNTIPNDDEALLATKKQKSFKGLVVGAALVSFALPNRAAIASVLRVDLPLRLCDAAGSGGFFCFDLQARYSCQPAKSSLSEHSL